MSWRNCCILYKFLFSQTESFNLIYCRTQHQLRFNTFILIEPKSTNFSIPQWWALMDLLRFSSLSAPPSFFSPFIDRHDWGSSFLQVYSTYRPGLAYANLATISEGERESLSRCWLLAVSRSSDWCRIKCFNLSKLHSSSCSGLAESTTPNCGLFEGRLRLFEHGLTWWITATIGVERLLAHTN